MSSEVKEFFRGEAKPEVEFSRRHPRYPWEAILDDIEPGTGREVVMSYGTCKHAIEELERANKIKKGEYRASFKMSAGGKRKVYIVRKAAKK